MAASTRVSDGEVLDLTDRLVAQRISDEASTVSACSKEKADGCVPLTLKGNDARKRSQGEETPEGDEDDWEAQLEKGTLGESLSTGAETTGCEPEEGPQSNLGERAAIPRWSEVILGEDEEFEQEPVADPNKTRPRTTTAVARRLLAHALNKPELIAQGEERELRALRDRNRQARKDRREQLDAVWGNE